MVNSETTLPGSGGTVLRRKRTVMAGAIAGMAMTLSAIAWACTPDQMLGVVWFCHTSTFCSSTQSPQVFSNNSTVYAREDGGWPNTDYYVRYILGTDLMSDCHTASGRIHNYTDNTDVFRTGGVSTFNKKTRMISTPGSYSVCGTPLSGVTPTAHTNITVL